MKNKGLSSIGRVPWCLSEFLRISPSTVEIVKSEKKPYDGWVIRSNGGICAHNFVWLLAIVHLLACEYCRERLNLDIKEVKREFKRLLKSIEKEIEEYHTPPFLRHLKS